MLPTDSIQIQICLPNLSVANPTSIKLNMYNMIDSILVVITFGPGKCQVVIN